MWSNKKPETPRAADTEPKNVQMNQPPKLASASWEGTPKVNKDVMHPTIVDSGWRDSAAGVDKNVSLRTAAGAGPRSI